MCSHFLIPACHNVDLTWDSHFCGFTLRVLAFFVFGSGCFIPVLNKEESGIPDSQWDAQEVEEEIVNRELREINAERFKVIRKISCKVI